MSLRLVEILNAALAEDDRRRKTAKDVLEALRTGKKIPARTGVPMVAAEPSSAETYVYGEPVALQDRIGLRQAVDARRTKPPMPYDEEEAAFNEYVMPVLKSVSGADLIAEADKLNDALAQGDQEAVSEYLGPAGVALLVGLAARRYGLGWLSKLPGVGKVVSKVSGKGAGAALKVVEKAAEGAVTPAVLEAAGKAPVSWWRKVLGGAMAAANIGFLGLAAMDVADRVKSSGSEAKGGNAASLEGEAPVGAGRPGTTYTQELLKYLDPSKIDPATDDATFYQSVADLVSPPDAQVSEQLSKYLLANLASEADVARELDYRRRSMKANSDLVDKYFASIDETGEVPVLAGAAAPTDDMVRAAGCVQSGVRWTPPGIGQAAE